MKVEKHIPIREMNIEQHTASRDVELENRNANPLIIQSIYIKATRAKPILSCGQCFKYIIANSQHCFCVIHTNTHRAN